MIQCSHCGRLNPPDAPRCERCDEPLARAAPVVVVGQVIEGRYRIDEFLGSGGMGQVFAATDVRLERPVALKMLNADLLQNATARRRMEGEAKALGRVRHTNVVEVHNLLEYQGMLVLDLELVRGPSLADRLNDGPIPCDESLRLFAGILAGLEAIHAAQIVHRDVKPGNILLAGGSVPKVADLGIAHDVGAARMTKLGAQLGTPEYMSPEQIRGDVVDVRTDVYACGIMLYEMLSGEVPFQGKSEFDVQSGHVHQPPDLTKLEGHAPASVIACVARALEKATEARWQSVTEMSAALLHGKTEPKVEPRVEPKQPTPPPPSALAAEPPPRPPPNVIVTAGAGVSFDSRASQPLEEDEAPDSEPEREPAAAAKVRADGAKRKGSILIAALVLGCSAIALLAALLSGGKDSGAAAAAPGATTIPAASQSLVGTVEAARPGSGVEVVDAGSSRSALPLAPTSSLAPPASEATTAPQASKPPSLVPASAQPNKPRPATPPVRASAPQPPPPLLEPAATAPPPTAAPNCVPPYTYDESGMKRYKPGCE